MRAGVSVSTASLALNHRPGVREETRQAVLKAAHELGYRPNGIARDLKGQKTDSIAILLHDFSGPFYSELLRGVQDVAEQHGYTALAARVGRSARHVVNHLLLEHRVNGAVVLDPTIDDRTLMEAAHRRLPIVVCDRVLMARHIYAVTADNEGGGYAAASHILAQGCRRIAFLAGPENSRDSRLRWEGFQRALQEAGVPFSPDRFVRGGFTQAGAYEAMRALLRRDRDLDAVFAANDEMALGALQALTEHGLRVPADVVLVGFDNILVSAYVTPALTTVEQPMYELGATAARLLFRALGGERDLPPVILPTRLIVRASSQR